MIEFTKDIDYEKIYRLRYERLQKIREDNRTLQGHKKYYEENPIDFMNDWYMTYDPRRNPALIPFILFKKQREFVHFILDLIKNKTDGLIEKTRDMGATWLCMGISIWMWLFWNGAKVSFGSWKQEKIDKLGDPDTIFEKGRILIRYLPNEFLPSDFDENKHLSFLRFVNSENGNTITGESGDNIGRGGRSLIYFKDEAAFYMHPDKIDSALSQNTDVQIDLSTPNGIGNPFYRKRMGGKIPVFTFHWRDHPLKDQTWYNNEVQKRDPTIIAQEIDINYHASIEQVVIPIRYIRAAVGLKLDTTGNKRAGLDVADEGQDMNAQAFAEGNTCTEIMSWKEGNTTQTARKAYFNCKQKDIHDLRYDNVGVGAGVKGTLTEMDMSEFKVECEGINSGSSPTDGQVEEGKDNKDMFLNLKAQMWWTMRKRFMRTFEHVNGLKEYLHDDLISIPDDAELIAELSQPKYEQTETGKLKIESKDKMKRRGVKSPNKADALVLCFIGNLKPKVIGSLTYSENYINAVQ